MRKAPRNYRSASPPTAYTCSPTTTTSITAKANTITPPYTPNMTLTLQAAGLASLETESEQAGEALAETVKQGEKLLQSIQVIIILIALNVTKV